MNLKPITLIILMAGAAHAQILNGDFETPVVPTTNIAGIGLVPGINLYTSALNATGITNWDVSSGDVSLVDAGGTLTTNLGLFGAHTGSQYVVLNGLQENVTLGLPPTVSLAQTGTYGTFQQTFTTNPGTQYQISFGYRGLAVGALNGNPILDVNVSNSMNSTAPANGTLTANISLNAWNTDTFNFVATGSNSTLSFYQANSGPTVGLVGLDSVTLTALPEPSQYGAAAVAFLLCLVGGRLFAQWRIPAKMAAG